MFEMGEVFCDVGPSATLFQEQSLSVNDNEFNSLVVFPQRR